MPFGDYALQGLLSHITALFFTVHMMFGCCLHHAHACSDGCGRNCLPGHELIGSPAIYQTCEGNRQCEVQGHGSLDCQEFTCVFIGSLSVQVMETGRSASPMVILPMPHDCLFPAVAPGGRFFFVAGCLAPPIRLHLANRVLLI